MKEIKKIVSAIVLGFFLMLSAQEIKLLEVIIERGILGESFSKLPRSYKK